MKKDIILNGDVYACLEYLEDNSIAVAITSPPYWKQRDYMFENQIGQEKTVEEYIGRLLKIYNKLRQKLNEDGVFFLNIGDKYLNQYGKSKLLQIPYRLAYHMVKDGWYLEDIIIWYKINHMPSSVKDRLSNTYEPVLVLSKNKCNIYKKNYPKVVELPLQQTPWKHTATYPENLVREMLERVNLKDGDIVIDPFAGTGTTAVIVEKIKNDLFYNYNIKRIYSVMIEKSEEFIKIIKERTGIHNIVKIEDKSYEWKEVKEEFQIMNENKNYRIINTNKYGEVCITKDKNEFLSVLSGMTKPEFREFHREDALYFIGVKDWDLDSLYYVQNICNYGYVLRNKIVISDGYNWYPIFMIARDSTKVAYRFILDRLRIKQKTKKRETYKIDEFIGMKVRDITGKEPIEGSIVKVLEKYNDEFPKIVVVHWNGKASIEFVIHPSKDILLMEGIKFICPQCNNEIIESYDPLGENICRYCKIKLWTTIDNVPNIQEPEEIINIINELEKYECTIGQVLDIKELRKRKITNSKFNSLERINWGASPGARKTILGEYFTKMRIYRIDQPTIAQYLNILRKHKNISIQNIIDKLPKKYRHTVGHWFRKDFGGSIPIPEDIEKIEKIFEFNNGLIKILKRTALKFQTVKESIKGKNPGDYWKNKNENEIVNLLKLLYIPSNEYIKNN